MSDVNPTPGQWQVMGPLEHSGAYSVVALTPEGGLLRQFYIGNHTKAGEDAALVCRALNHHQPLIDACWGMADRLAEYAGELATDRLVKEAANIARIEATLRRATREARGW